MSRKITPPKYEDSLYAGMDVPKTTTTTNSKTDESESKSETQSKINNNQSIMNHCKTNSETLNILNDIETFICENEMKNTESNIFKYIKPTPKSKFSAKNDRLRDVSDMPPVLEIDPTKATSVKIKSRISTVKGMDFEKGNSIDMLLNAFKNTGFQATNLSDACDRINEMIYWRMPEEMAKSEEFKHLSSEEVKNARSTIFLGMTSNQISSGQREVIRYLCKHNMIDCIVTSAGAIEEDIMKCFAPHYMGDFSLKGKELRIRGINRIGNLVVPSDNYCNFEQWLMPILEEMLKEQKSENIIYSPSMLIRRMGKEINNEESVWYWCYKNNIPVFCPGITDGAVGDVLYFFSYKEDGFILDLVKDIRLVNDIALRSIMSGMIILGGGLIKHHICNANLLRNGANWSVFVNTGQEFDGSDSGAKPDEAVSWGKIRLDAKPVKVYGDATVFFPIIVAGTFGHPIHKQYASKPKRKLDEAYNIKQLE